MRALTPPIALVGLKAYLGDARTRGWFDGLRGLVEAGRAEGVSLVVIPSATAIAALAAPASALGVVLGAQDCSQFPPGAWTGELPATLLAEVGASVVEVGHAERRRYLHETDEVVAAKARAAAAAGLVPMVCVGERRPAASAMAADEVVGQLAAFLDGVPASAPVLVAYEPEWAIGAADPAPTSHVREVAVRLRDWLGRYADSALIYGGAAGPGTYAELAGSVDGLGLGRRVHDVAELAAVLDEMRGVAPKERRMR